MPETTIHSRDLLAMAKEAIGEDGRLSTRALGWSVIAAILDDCEGAERWSFRAWEQGDDYRLGGAAIGLLERMRTTRKHFRWTAKLEVSAPPSRRRTAR